MKNRFIYSIIIGSLSLGLLSCSDFLTETPEDQLPPEIVEQDPYLVYLANVSSLYSEIGGNGWYQGIAGPDRGLYDFNTFTTDEAILPKRGGDWSDNGLWKDIFQHNWSVDNEMFKGIWDYLYRVVGKSNQSLQNLEATKAKYPEEPAVYDALIAEVKTFRAMYYYYLMDFFARVPIVQSPDETIADIKQSKRSEVFEFVKTELQNALPYLPNERSNNKGEYYGRMTKPVAYYLLAKIALNAEIYTNDTWDTGTHPDGSLIIFNVGGQELNAWEAAAAYCDSITNSGLEYALNPTFSANFSTTNETSTENLFTIPMDPAIYVNAKCINIVRTLHYNHAKYYNQTGWNGASATKEAIQAFGYFDATPDPRWDMTYFYGLVPGVTDENGNPLEYVADGVSIDVSGTSVEKTAGARMKKYEIDRAATDNGQLVHNDYVLFRYADVLLMKSEALVRNGQSGQAEFDMIRNRVSAPARTATLDNILTERMLEFAWEGVRRQDLVRFGKFTIAITDRPASQPYTTVFPIPQEVIRMNPDNITQNPGYTK